MRSTILFLILTATLCSCQLKNEKKDKAQPKQQSVVIDSIIPKKLCPLAEGELIVSEEDFGQVISLEGKPHEVDKFFRVKECQMLSSDSLLIVKNGNDSFSFMAFSLPDFQFVKSFGKRGEGPGEFRLPYLVKDESGAFICFVYDRGSDKLYSVNRNFEVEELPIELERNKDTYFDKQPYGVSSNEFLYVESIKQGKAVFHVQVDKDTTKTELLKKLAFSNQHKNWAAYIGDFGVNASKQRLVFAYKYFKRLVFCDIENMTSKVVDFESEKQKKRGSAISVMSPENITHYWGMSVQDDHVYVLYSGRSPIDVSKELRSSSGYIYIEKFDWNGNPVAKYKLDNWGYFCVAEDERTLYLASTTDEYPFLSYQLPLVSQ